MESNTGSVRTTETSSCGRRISAQWATTLLPLVAPAPLASYAPCSELSLQPLRARLLQFVFTPAPTMQSSAVCSGD